MAMEELLAKGILRVRGGSSFTTQAAEDPQLYSPRARR